MRRQRHEEHRRAQQHDLRVARRRGQPERTGERPVARRQQPADNGPEHHDAAGDGEQAARHLGADAGQSAQPPDDELRVLGENEEQHRAAEFEKRRAQRAGEISRHCAASQVGVEEPDDVGGRPNRQQIAVADVAVEPADHHGEHQRVPRKVE